MQALTSTTMDSSSCLLFISSSTTPILHGKFGLARSRSDFSRPKDHRLKHATTQRRARPGTKAVIQASDGYSMPYRDDSSKKPIEPSFKTNEDVAESNNNGIVQQSGTRQSLLIKEREATVTTRHLEDKNPQVATSIPISFLGFRFNIPGRFVLLMVPMLWASYPICLKVLFLLPWALSAPVFNSMRLTLAALTVLPTLISGVRKLGQSSRPDQLRNITAAGTELGLYTIAVNILQGYGLQYTTASRGAFLSQLVTIIVPVLAFVTKLEASLGLNIILAAVMALGGVGLLTLDDVGGQFTLRGDGALLMTAFLGSAYLLRSKMHASKAEYGPLAEMKVAMQTIFALMFCFVTSRQTGAAVGTGFMSMFAGASWWTLALNALIVWWAGVFISVASTKLQLKGQAMVSASEAVIIFTLTPLWVLVMGLPLGERFGTKGMIGAALILVSTILASKQRNTKQKLPSKIQS